MITAQKIFDMAVAFMDISGDGSEADIAEYRARAVPILNTLRGELAACCLPMRQTCPPLNALSDGIDLDDTLCATVLPYGLAAALLVGERNEEASFFQTRYETLLRMTKAASQAQGEDIKQLYGDIGDNWGRW